MLHSSNKEDFEVSKIPEKDENEATDVKISIDAEKVNVKTSGEIWKIKTQNYCGIDVTDSSNEEDIYSNPNKEDNERSVGKVMASGWDFSINRIQIIIFKGMKRIYNVSYDENNLFCETGFEI